jgi:succinate dehydrogenase/fumarate reductase flavoprotein subunit
MAESLEQLRFWCSYVLRREFNQQEGWELSNLLTISSLMLGSAKVREESRGTHFRRDFPKRDDFHWRKRITCEPGGNICADA